MWVHIHECGIAIIEKGLIQRIINNQEFQTLNRYPRWNTLLPQCIEITIKLSAAIRNSELSRVSRIGYNSWWSGNTIYHLSLSPYTMHCFYSILEHLVGVHVSEKLLRKRRNNSYYVCSSLKLTCYTKIQPSHSPTWFQKEIPLKKHWVK